MLREIVMRTVGVFLIAVVSIGTVAQSQGGMLTATAGVTVNGKAAPADVNTAVLLGDRIQTGAGTAQVRLEGSLLQLGPNSGLVVAAVPEFGCGQMAYFTFKAAPLRVGSVEVKPASSAETKFEVVHAAGTITVAVMVGSVLFVHNGETTTLRSGESTTVADNADCPAILSTAAPLPAAQSTLRNGKLIGILAGAGGGGAVAAILLTREKAPVSPSRP